MSVKRTQGNNTPDRPEWVRFLEGYCGVKSYGKWRDWLDFIAVKPGGLTNEPTERELLETVKFVSSQDDVSFADITARKLAGWVRWYRKEQAAGRHGYSRDTTEGGVDAVWQSMLRAPDFASRWELLVEGGEPLPPEADGKYQARPGWTKNHCKDLENRARRRWSDWDERKTDYFKGMWSVQHVIGSIAASMLPAPDVDVVPF